VWSAIEGPGDAWLLLRMVGWRIVLPLRTKVLPLPRLARMMWVGEPSRRASPQRDARITTLAHGLYGPWNTQTFNNCLDRSLLTYRFLSAAGAEPRLVVGFANDGGPVRGHAWITLAGQSLHEPDDVDEEFTPVVAFGRDGTPIPQDADTADDGP
jgi:hypothetical protein